MNLLSLFVANFSPPRKQNQPFVLKTKKKWKLLNSRQENFPRKLNFFKHIGISKLSNKYFRINELVQYRQKEITNNKNGLKRTNVENTEAERTEIKAVLGTKKKTIHKFIDY